MGGKLEGKTAIITGAGQGVGQGIAFALSREGVSVAALGRTESKLLDTVAQIESFGGHGLPVVCDIRDGGQVASAVERTVAALGGVDMLINNAQDPAAGPLLTLSDEAFASALASGPFAAFRFMKACHPHMKARGGGSIVNVVTSIAEQANTAGWAAYTAAKQAMRALTRAAACEFGADKIRVNSIAPLANSPATVAWMAEDPSRIELYKHIVPLGYVGDCERDIGRAVLFLVGPDAGYITGATLPVDGGLANFG